MRFVKIVLFSFVVIGLLSQSERPVAAMEAEKELNQADAIHEQLRALREKFLAAVNAKDYEAVVALLHPEVVLTAQDGKNLNLIRRHEGVRKYFNRLLVSSGHGVESLELNPTVDDLSMLYHNNTAVAFGSSIDHYRLVNGSEFDLKTRWSVTIVKEGDKWLIACLHVSSNLFENPVLATVSRMAMWLAIGAGFVCLVAGLFIGRLRSRPIEA